MKFRNRRQDDSGTINITSLVDLVFILLIFFAVTTSFTAPSSIKVDLPKAKGEAVEQKRNIEIAIDKTGKIFIDGKPIKDDQLLGSFTLLKQSNPEALVAISADKDALHGKVVTVIDAAKSADFTRFAIVTDGTDSK